MVDRDSLVEALCASLGYADPPRVVTGFVWELSFNVEAVIERPPSDLFYEGAGLVRMTVKGWAIEDRMALLVALGLANRSYNGPLRGVHDAAGNEITSHLGMRLTKLMERWETESFRPRRANRSFEYLERQPA